MPSGKILVVEDDPWFLEFVVMKLQSLHFDVVAAESGAAALDVLESTPDISLLFTDIVLPNDFSGAALAREALQRWPELEVLFMSGYPRDNLEKHGFGNYAHFLKKPFSHEQLEEALAVFKVSQKNS